MSSNEQTFNAARSLTALNGYDAVAYFTDGKPVRGSGHHVTVVDGVTYLFASEDNKKVFEANPGKFIPAFGGFCAYGVSVGKKFVGDPEIWKIVGGKLYLNLDAKIQSEWEKDVPGHIRKADGAWPKIKDTPAAAL